jgi:hypothetical protein
MRPRTETTARSGANDAHARAVARAIRGSRVCPISACVRRRRPTLCLRTPRRRRASPDPTARNRRRPSRRKPLRQAPSLRNRICTARLGAPIAKSSPDVLGRRSSWTPTRAWTGSPRIARCPDWTATASTGGHRVGLARMRGRASAALSVITIPRALGRHASTRPAPKIAVAAVGTLSAFSSSRPTRKRFGTSSAFADASVTMSAAHLQAARRSVARQALTIVTACSRAIATGSAHRPRSAGRRVRGARTSVSRAAEIPIAEEALPAIARPGRSFTRRRSRLVAPVHR